MQGLSDALYTTPELAALFSGVGHVRRMLDFEAALARAGVIPTEAADAISAACRVDQFDVLSLLRDTAVAGTLAILLATPPHGYVGCYAALRAADLRHLASTVEAPSLVIGGELDEATPPAQAEDLHAAIVPSELMVIPGVAHLPNLEAPDLFNRRVLEHLSHHGPATR